ncbi:MAG: hypothetical protein ACRYFY_04845 [Janthinobacterium lividum]
MRVDQPWLDDGGPGPDDVHLVPMHDIRRPTRNPQAVIPRQHRRLPERILVAIHQACDLVDLEVAASLLQILEVVLLQHGSVQAGSQSPGPYSGSHAASRRSLEGMIAAYERLWHLRHANDPVEDSLPEAVIINQ